MEALTLANLIQPGGSIDAGVREGLVAQFSSQAGEKLVAAQETTFGINTFVNIVPRNPLDAAASGDMLALIFFTLVFAVALTRIPSEYSAPVVKVIEGVGQAVMVMIGFAMRLAPIGVAALIFGVTARFEDHLRWKS